MNNKLRKILLTGVLSGTMLLGLVGCGKPTTESLITKMISQNKDVESATLAMKLDGKIEMEGQSVELGMDMDMDMTKDPYAMYMQGEMGTSILGQEETMNMEMYGISVGDDEMELYVTLDGEEWSKSTESTEQSEDTDLGSLLSLGDDLLDVVDSFKLKEETVQVNDVECYQMRGGIDGKMLQEILDKSGLSESQGNVFGALNLEDSKLPIEINVSKKSGDLVCMKMNLSSVMEESMASFAGEYATNVEIEGFIMEISYDNLNKVDKIEVPKEVKEAAE